MNRPRVGLHGRNAVDFEGPDYQIINQAKIEVLKLMSFTDSGVFDQLKIANPDLLIITRLYDDRINTGYVPTPEEFSERMGQEILRLGHWCKAYEIHNEPNHPAGYEGWDSSDESAASFNNWFIQVYQILKARYPWASFGFPGLAIPHRDLEWLELCRPAIEMAGWLGVHCYWQTPASEPNNHLADFWGLRFKSYQAAFPDKDIHITEAGNSNYQSNIPWSEDQMAREYTEYLTECFKYPYLKSINFFIMSSPDPYWQPFCWREGDRLKPVVAAVGGLARG